MKMYKDREKLRDSVFPAAYIIFARICLAVINDIYYIKNSAIIALLFNSIT